MKKLQFILFLGVALLLLQSNVFAGEPFTFSFGNIPFGESMHEVLKLVEGAKITEDEDVSASFIADYGITTHFSGGWYTMWGMGSYFLSPVAKCYTVEYQQWEKIITIKLYFGKSFGEDNNDYTLFLVMKEQKTSGGNYKDVYSGFKNSITKVLDIRPSEYTGKYQDLILFSSNTYEPALIGLWKLKDQKVFLLVRNNMFSSGDPIMLYLSSSGWYKYINAVDSYEAAKKEETENDNQADF